jgi:hypothetical protein
VHSATDIANFLSCHHLSTLERAEARGEIRRSFFRDSGVELFRELGIRHEAQYLRQLIDREGFQIAHIPTDIPWGAAVARTIEALYRGVDAVYQATFQEGPWGGRADFLLRVEGSSWLGDFSYEVVETKLARSCQGPRNPAALSQVRRCSQVECKTPRQIELANAFCRYLEIAQIIR